jgi:hypothetical protein
MKKKPVIYDKYPIWVVLIVNILQLLVYAAGAYIMFVLHWITGILFIIYAILMEFSVYKEGCRYCCYYGGGCAFGKGAIAKIFYKKGNPKKFCERELKWKDFVPQILVVAIPVMVGIALLISRGFNWLILIAMIYPVFSWFALNPIIYGRLACIHCKQGSKCCPALDFFSKKEAKK